MTQFHDYRKVCCSCDTHLYGDDGGQILVHDLNRLGGALRDYLVVGRHRRHDLTEVLHLKKEWELLTTGGPGRGG